MKTVFIRAIEAAVDDKAEVIRASVKGPSTARFEADMSTFGQVPRSPFAYWISDALRKCFQQFPSFESDDRTTKQGLASADDFRFVRLATEVAPNTRGLNWFPFAKGGAFSRFYADVYLVVDWSNNGWKIKHNLNDAGRVRSNVWMLRDTAANYFFHPGLTWPLRTNGLSFRAMPRGCIFSHKGPTAFVKDDHHDTLLALSSLLNSRVFGALVAIQLARTELAQSYEVGLIQQTPIPDLGSADRDQIIQLARRSWSLKRRVDTRTENSHAFQLPALLQVAGKSLANRASAWAELTREVHAELDDLQAQTDNYAYGLYGITDEDRQRIEQGFGPVEPDEEVEVDDDDSESTEIAEIDAKPMVASLLSWSLGVAFGRFDVRLATGERPAPPEPEPFDPLPVCSPGMLTGADGLPAQAPPPDYPLSFPIDGILVDDPGHPRDLEGAVRAVFDTIFADADARWHEAAELLETGALRSWFASNFFEQHLKRYSRSRRKAPIYWQLATPSASYSLWIYIHRATTDTLFRVLNDYVGPKLNHEKSKLDALARDAGPSPSVGERRDLDTQELFVNELQAFKAELARVAPLWKLDLDDGVILNSAPLWRLVPHHRGWQNECKKAWDKLATGDYDWAHLAMHLWPERVVPKCSEDASLAIAHGLDKVFWYEDESGKWQKKEIEETTVRKMITERTSPTVKASLKELLTAPTPVARGKKKAARR